MLNAMFVVKTFATTRDNEIQESVREQMSAKSSKFGMVQMTAGTSVTVGPLDRAYRNVAISGNIIVHISKGTRKTVKINPTDH